MLCSIFCLKRFTVLSVIWMLARDQVVQVWHFDTSVTVQFRLDWIFTSNLHMPDFQWVVCIVYWQKGLKDATKVWNTAATPMLDFESSPLKQNTTLHFDLWHPTVSSYRKPDIVYVLSRATPPNVCCEPTEHGSNSRTTWREAPTGRISSGAFTGRPRRKCNGENVSFSHTGCCSLFSSLPPLNISVLMVWSVGGLTSHADIKLSDCANCKCQFCL